MARPGPKLSSQIVLKLKFCCTKTWKRTLQKISQEIYEKILNIRKTQTMITMRCCFAYPGSRKGPTIPSVGKGCQEVKPTHGWESKTTLEQVRPFLTALNTPTPITLYLHIDRRKGTRMPTRRLQQRLEQVCSQLHQTERGLINRLPYTRQCDPDWRQQAVNRADSQKTIQAKKPPPPTLCDFIHEKLRDIKIQLRG